MGTLYPGRKKTAELALDMKDSTRSKWMHMVGVRAHVLITLSCVALAVLGRMPESSGGWVSCAPRPAIGVARYRDRKRRERVCRDGGWRYVFGSWRVPVARSLAVWGMWLVSGGRGPSWVVLLPWLLWLWQSGGRLWPKLRLEPEWGLVGWVLWQGQRLALVGYLELAGYDISQLPMATLCNGLSLDWPLEVVHNDVPNR